jgi:hypothetical protein
MGLAPLKREALIGQIGSQQGLWIIGAARPFSDIGASREQTVYMGKAGSAMSGILDFVLRDSAGFARH